MTDMHEGENPEQYGEQLRREIQEKIHRKMEWRRRHHGRGGLFGGLMLILFGTLFLLQNLGVRYFDQVWRFWPVILIVLGLVRVARGWGFGGRIFGAAITGAGVLFLLRNFHYIHGNVWNFVWPVLLICLGLGMFAGTLARRRRWAMRGGPGSGSAGCGPGRGGPSIGGPGFGGPGGADRGGPGMGGPGGGGPVGEAPRMASASLNVLDETAILGGIRKRIETQAFEGGQATAVCGGIELDLTRAASKRDEVVIEATAVFGGIDMRVPENWKVSSRGGAILGGFDDQTREPRLDEAMPQTHLVVLGNAIFGGVTIKN